MAGETIFLVDVDEENEQKIASTLETEGYLVFTVSGSDISSAAAQKIKPSLIFVNPAASGSRGLETCEKIHKNESLQNVPIMVLTSYEGAMDPRYTDLYGIVDFLKKPFNPELLVEKTERALSMKSLEIKPVMEEDMGSYKEEYVPVEEQDMPVSKAYTKETDFSAGHESGQTAGEREEEYKDDYKDTFIPKKGMKTGKKNRFLVPLLVVMIFIIIAAAGAGVLFYTDLIPWRKVQTNVAVSPARPAPQPGSQASLPQEQPEQQQPAEENKPVPEQKPLTETKPLAEPKPADAHRPSPAHVSETAVKKKPAGRPVYSVQIGAFKNESGAESLTKKYKEKGYNAFTQKGTTKGKEIIYRVLISGSEDRGKASELANSIQAKENIKVTIFCE